MLRGISFPLQVLLMSMVMSIESIEAQCLDLKNVLGIKQFKKLSLENKETLDVKLKSRQKKIRSRQKTFYMLSQNVVTEDILQLANDLLYLDYPEIFNFDGKNKIGPTFIPECFIPKKPRVVEPENAKTVLENNPNDKKLQGEIRQTKGDILEKEVYETLLDYYKSKNEDVLVIHGIEMQRYDFLSKIL